MSEIAQKFLHKPKVERRKSRQAGILVADVFWSDQQGAVVAYLLSTEWRKNTLLSTDSTGRTCEAASDPGPLTSD